MRKISNDEYLIEYSIEEFEYNKENLKEIFDFEYFMDNFDEETDLGLVIKINAIDKKTGDKKTYLVGDDCASNTNEERVILNDKYVFVLLHYGDIVKINLKTAQIEKKLELERWGTYYDIYNFGDHIIISGELAIYSLDYELNILKKFETPDVIIDFKIENNFIFVKDFNDNLYTLDLYLNK